MMALLTVDKLSKTYQATSKKAVKDISFAVDHGGRSWRYSCLSWTEWCR